MGLHRASGILLHPTCLPSAHGIGDLGKGAYDFIDFLAASGQKLWQILPLGPTGYEHSPYIMNFSTFAGNPLLISLEKLVEAGLLTTANVEPLAASSDANPDQVAFNKVIPHKTRLFELAYQNFRRGLEFNPNPDFDQFCAEQTWLDDYALFMAIHESNPGKTWNQWEAPLARRYPEALTSQRQVLADRILYHKFLQFQFFEQWQQLRTHAQEREIQIIGDLSIYVCYDSADVWANPEIFQLDPTTLEATYIAGVPPDYFSATGQLWGNPVYNWDKLKETRFTWWVERFRTTLQYVDWVRVDHFRGFEAYWRVPAAEPTALKGEWIAAPGYELFETLGEQLGELPILAEDLGTITPAVEALRDRFGFPGMKVLQFAFSDTQQNPYLLHNHTHNAIVYTGTHDNNTTVGWWNELEAAQKQIVARYLGYDSPAAVVEIHWDLMRLAMSSLADFAIIPLQDVLGLGSEQRLNDPSVNEGNWRWRYPRSNLLTMELSDRLRQLTEWYRR